MEDDGSGKDDLEGETHTVWQILNIEFCIFTCISHPLQAYYVLVTVCVTRATWSGGMSEPGRLTMAQSQWGAKRQA